MESSSLPKDVKCSLAQCFGVDFYPFNQWNGVEFLILTDDVTLVKIIFLQLPKIGTALPQDTDTEPTHPLTARSVSDHEDEHDIVNESHLRDVEDWNFSSVATIDSHSLTAEERQKIIIDNLYTRKEKEKPKKKIKSSEDDKPTDCFNSLFLQLFDKVSK